MPNTPYIQIRIVSSNFEDEYNFEFKTDKELVSFMRGIATGEITNIESCFGSKVVTEEFVPKTAPQDDELSVIILGFDPLEEKK